MLRLPAPPAWRNLPRDASRFDGEPVPIMQTIPPRTAAAPPDPRRDDHGDTVHPTTEAWLALADLAAGAGPSADVPGAHRPRQRRPIRERRTAIEASAGADHNGGSGSPRATPTALRRCGCDAPPAFAIPGGTLVAGDTAGPHVRGPSLPPPVHIGVPADGWRDRFPPPAGIGRQSLAGPARWRTCPNGWRGERPDQSSLRQAVGRPTDALTADAPRGSA